MDPTSNFSSDSAKDDLNLSASGRATKLAPGVTLHTRDGKIIGNAIVIWEIRPHPVIAEFLQKRGHRIWLIETDFGNRLRYSDGEIEKYFELGFQSDYLRWKAARQMKCERSLGHDSQHSRT